MLFGAYPHRTSILLLVSNANNWLKEIHNKVTRILNKVVVWGNVGLGFLKNLDDYTLTRYVF